MDRATIIELRKLLAKLYPGVTTIQRVLDDAEIDWARINSNAALLDVWHAALTEAEKVGRLDQLLAVVNREYGTNQEFQHIYSAYLQSTGQISPVSQIDRPQPPREIAKQTKLIWRRWLPLLFATLVLIVLLIVFWPGVGLWGRFSPLFGLMAPTPSATIHATLVDQHVVVPLAPPAATLTVTALTPVAAIQTLPTFAAPLSTQSPGLTLTPATVTPVPFVPITFPLRLTVDTILDYQQIEGQPQRLENSKARFKLARWRFNADSTFSFIPADARDDLYPLDGTYRIARNIIHFNANRSAPMNDSITSFAQIEGELDLNLTPPRIMLSWVNRADMSANVNNTPFRGGGSASNYEITALLQVEPDLELGATEIAEIVKFLTAVPAEEDRAETPRPPTPFVNTLLQTITPPVSVTPIPTVTAPAAVLTPLPAAGTMRTIAVDDGNEKMTRSMTVMR